MNIIMFKATQMETNSQLIEQISATVRDHLTQQRAKSMGPRPSEDLCLYRGANGAMCAAGCLIADEHFDKDLEALTVTDPKVTHAIFESLDMQGENPITQYVALSMVESWQLYHDDCYFGIGKNGDQRPYSYGRWCETGDPAHSPDTFEREQIEPETVKHQQRFMEETNE